MNGDSGVQFVAARPRKVCSIAFMNFTERGILYNTNTNPPELFAGISNDYSS